MFVLLFPEINTVTIDREKLNEIGRRLEMRDTRSRHFNTLQYLIKDQVNDFIKEEGIQNESVYIKCAISEWIV